MGSASDGGSNSSRMGEIDGTRLIVGLASDAVVSGVDETAAASSAFLVSVGRKRVRRQIEEMEKVSGVKRTDGESANHRPSSADAVSDGQNGIAVAAATTAEARERVGVVGGAYQVFGPRAVAPPRNADGLNGIQGHPAKSDAGDGSAHQACSGVSIGLSSNLNYVREAVRDATGQVPAQIDGPFGVPELLQRLTHHRKVAKATHTKYVDEPPARHRVSSHTDRYPKERRTDAKVFGDDDEAASVPVIERARVADDITRRETKECVKADRAAKDGSVGGILNLDTGIRDLNE